MTRLFVGGLDDRISQTDLEKEFKPFGHVEDVFVARNPPGFGFIVFEKSRDAERAIKDMDGVTLGSQKIRVEHARPRGAPGGRGGGRGSRSDIKCFNCNGFGHISRECRNARGGGGGGGARSRSRSPRSRSPAERRPSRRSPSKSRSRSRSPRERPGRR